METTYKGITTKLSNLLLEPIEKRINNPRKSNKFPSESLYYNGRYYFYKDIKLTDNEYRIKEGNIFEIQVVYYSYKWYQDTSYINREFKDFLEGFI